MRPQGGRSDKELAKMLSLKQVFLVHFLAYFVEGAVVVAARDHANAVESHQCVVRNDITLAYRQHSACHSQADNFG